MHGIDAKGFQCVAKMFLMLNDFKNKIDLISYDGKISLTDMVVHTNPAELSGIELIWQIYENSSPDSESQIIDFLGKLYLD